MWGLWGRAEGSEGDLFHLGDYSSRSRGSWSGGEQVVGDFGWGWMGWKVFLLFIFKRFIFCLRKFLNLEMNNSLLILCVCACSCPNFRWYDNLWYDCILLKKILNFVNKQWVLIWTVLIVTNVVKSTNVTQLHSARNVFDSCIMKFVDNHSIVHNEA